MIAREDIPGRVLQLLSIDPGGLRGLTLRGRLGPVRDRIVAAAGSFDVRLHPALDDEALYGGTDIAASLAKGAVVTRTGVLRSAASRYILTNAERVRPPLAARLCQAVDDGDIGVLLALDEGAEPDEGAPPSLRDRLAFVIDVEGLRDCALPEMPASRSVRRAPALDETIEQMVLATQAFGIEDMRIPYFAVRAARANAILRGATSIEAEDMELAAALVIAPRARQLPEHADREQQPEPEQKDDRQAQGSEELEDTIVAAAMAFVPPGLLDRLKTAAAAGSGGQGAAQRGNRRGRPLPATERPGTSAQVDLIATLRAAAPWQGLRRREAPTDPRRVLLRKSDLRYRAYEEHSDRLLIFAVDASGSAAAARLAETKGAIEHLLSQAYANRDHVAVVAFRGDGAEVVLPPTRALAQAKRRLASLPGGGGTPLAAGLMAAGALAKDGARRGMSPAIIALTDGRGNIGLDPDAGRMAAREDTAMVAKRLARERIGRMVIDTGNRPREDAKKLAQMLDGTYLALPHADARRIGSAIGAALAR